MKKLILAVVLMTGLLWAEERKVTVGKRISPVSNSVMTPAGIYSSRLWISEIVPVDKEVVKVVYNLRHIDDGIIYYTEYLKKGDKFYERLSNTGDEYNIYILKDFGYNVLKFDIDYGEFKFSDLITSY